MEGLNLVDGLQLFANIGALIGGFSVWMLYIGNLKAALAAKDAEISHLKTSRDDLKEKAEALEKRAPEYMEKVLSDRIEHREAEIKRLQEDQGENGERIGILEQEKTVLEGTLEKTQSLTRGFMEVLSLEREELGGLDLENVKDLEVVKLGDVGVDSGQLLITDPCYLENEWLPARLEGAEIYVDPLKNTIYQVGRDFTDYDETLPSYEKTVRELIESGTLVKREIEDSDLYEYSYEGVCKAVFGSGYGELAYRRGHQGAGVAFATAFGDGLYPIYGEKHDGRIVRVYVNVA